MTARPLRLVALALLLALGLPAAPGLAASRDGFPLMDLRHSQPGSPVAPCSGRYPRVGTLDYTAGGAADVEAAIAARAASLDRVWGLAENARIAAGTAGPALEVRFPEGSINPGRDDGRPLGGAGFVATLGGGGLRAACLRYAVRFDDGFAFALGGKLPGLYGGTGPTGSEPATDGFSMRLMWRRGGAGEAYAYVINKERDYGASIGRGRWTFPAGHWVDLEIEVVLNDPARADGILRVWADGRQVVEQDDVAYRSDRRVTVDGLMFSTFFGGSDPKWASPHDQSARFGPFTLYGAR